MGLQLADDNFGYVTTGTTIRIGRSTTIELTPPDVSGLDGIHIGHGYGATSVGLHGPIDQLVELWETGLALLLERRTELETMGQS